MLQITPAEITIQHLIIQPDSLLTEKPLRMKLM